MRSVREIQIAGALVAAVAFCLTGIAAAANYGGGTGTADDPYQIWTAEQMNAIGAEPNDWDKHFKLMADLDLSALPETSFGGIGTGETPFIGVFDGNRHTIANFFYRGVAAGHASPGYGLFRVVGDDSLGSRGEIRDLRLVDADVDVLGGYGVGLLVGYLDDRAMVANCRVTGKVAGSWAVGGLLGFLQGTARVVGCCATVAVTGQEAVGGLVGYGEGEIRNCYAKGSVTGDDGIGGLIGDNLGTILASYSTGRVLGRTCVGGLVGTSDGSDSGWSSFWDVETSGQTGSGAGKGQPTAQMQRAQTFLGVGWDFVGETANGVEDIWWIPEGQDYPRLSWERYAGGRGTKDDPYQIATAADLIAVGETLGDYGKHFVLTADIDLDPNLPGRRVFDKAVIAPDKVPPDSSGSFAGRSFTGVFDGNGHVVRNLHVRGGGHLGLFGYLTSNAEILHLGLEGIEIDGMKDDIGGLVGQCFGRIISSYCVGIVRGDNRVGGLVGQTGRPASLTACHTICSVMGDEVGGLVGRNWGDITTSYSSGAVTGGEDCGGLVASNYGHITASYSAGIVDGSFVVGGLACWSKGSITASYSTCRVRGKLWWIGGFMGWNEGHIAMCYSTGLVAGKVNAGGFVGQNDGTITGSFWDAEASGWTLGVAGTGKTTAEMQRSGTFLDAGWDFEGESANGTEDIWWIDEGWDYPRLRWEVEEKDDGTTASDD